jgi:hypothetical protein
MSVAPDPRRWTNSLQRVSVCPSFFLKTPVTGALRQGAKQNPEKQWERAFRRVGRFIRSALTRVALRGHLIQVGVLRQHRASDYSSARRTRPALERDRSVKRKTGERRVCGAHFGAQIDLPDRVSCARRAFPAFGRGDLSAHGTRRFLPKWISRQRESRFANSRRFDVQPPASRQTANSGRSSSPPHVGNVRQTRQPWTTHQFAAHGHQQSLVAGGVVDERIHEFGSHERRVRKAQDKLSELIWRTINGRGVARVLACEQTNRSMPQSH